MNKKASILILLVAVATGIFLSQTETVAQSQKENVPVTSQQSVRTVQPEPAEGYRQARTYTGVIEANRTSELSFLRSGRLQKLLVNEGDTVQKGQLLALLDTRSLNAQGARLRAQRDRSLARLQELRRGPRVEPRRGAQAQVQRIEADLRLEELKLTRRRELFAKGAIPRENLDELEARVAVTRANLESAKQNSLELDNGTRPEVIAQAQADLREVDAALQALEVDYQDSELRAPYSGRVASRLLDEGTILGPGTAIFLLDEGGAREALIDLPANLPPPAEAEIVLRDQTVRGKLLAEPSRIDQNSFTQKTRYKLSGGLPGEPVTLRIDEFVEEPGLWLPMAALTSSGNGLWRCYSVGPENTVNSQQLEILHRAGDRVLVRGTLAKSDRVIVDGVQSVVTGQQVAVLP